jgi:hypothetical protein
VLCERAAFLADIAAVDHRIRAKLLTTTRCPARFNLDRTFFPGSTEPRGAWNPAFHTVVFMANVEVVPKVVQDLDSGFSRRLHNTISTPRFFVGYIAEELEVHTQALFC